MDKLNLCAVLNLQRKDKKGRCAIRLRSTVKRKVSYYATGISVLPEQFENGEIIRHPNKVQLNTEIRDLMHEFERNILEGKFTGKIKGQDFFTFSTKKIEQTKSKDSHGTWKHKKSYLKKLKEFAPDLHFPQITPSFMLDYENYCRSKGNKDTTVWSAVKFIKTMVNAARNDNVITVNPMRGYKAAAYVNPVRSYLTDHEIELIEKFANENTNPTLVKVANWFLFACYSGLRYDDIKNFDKRNIVDGRIILRTGKFKVDVSIKIHPKLLAILEKIQPKVFTNQKMNDYLKLIGIESKIDKNITMHVARHTFSVYFLNHGGSIETLSKILGHSSTKVTSIYGKITNIRIDSEIEKVWGSVAKIKKATPN